MFGFSISNQYKKLAPVPSRFCDGLQFVAVKTLRGLSIVYNSFSNFGVFWLGHLWPSRIFYSPGTKSKTLIVPCILAGIKCNVRYVLLCTRKAYEDVWMTFLSFPWWIMPINFRSNPEGKFDFDILIIFMESYRQFHSVR